MSAITTIRVKNFMSIEDATLTFDNRNILNIKGYNDSGKSAILKAVEVALFDKYKTKQSKFIRDGQDYFRVVITFDDGISIVRDKYRTGQSLYEMYSQKEKVFTTAVGETLSKVDGVPKTISDYLNLAVSNSVILNSRINTDKQLLVETSGSENFSALNEILRTSEISRAVAMVNVDRNKLTTQLRDDEVDIRSIEMQILDLRGLDEQLVKTLGVHEATHRATAARHDDLKRLTAAATGAQQVYDAATKMVEIDTTGVQVAGQQLRQATAIHHTATRAATAAIPATLVSLPTAQVQAVYQAHRAAQAVHRSTSAQYAGVVVPQVPATQAQSVGNLIGVQAVLNGVLEITSKYMNAQRKYEQCKTALNNLVRESNIDIYECGHCGEINLAEHKHDGDN